MEAIEFIHPLDDERLAESPNALSRTRLDRVAAALRSATTVAEVFEELAGHMPDELPFDRLGLALLSEDGASVVAHGVCSRRPALKWGVGETRPLLGSSLEPLLAEGAVRILHDLRLYLSLRPSSLPTQRLIAEGMRSSLTLPLYAAGAPVGFLFVTSEAPDAYEATHVAIAASLAPVVGEAVGRAIARERASHQAVPPPCPLIETCCTNGRIAPA